MNTDYSITIKSSSRELTAKEKVALKNSNGCIKLDEATKNGELLISPCGYAVLGIHNEKSADKDYEQYVVFDTDGQRYVTGSKSFFNSFIDIYTELNDKDGAMIEEYSLRVFRRPSRNYSGKDFLTCDVI